MAPLAEPANCPAGGQEQQMWGKYRGKVLDNEDPMMLGRIMPDVPALPGMVLNWAMPCVPYAGEQVGFYAIPPIGASVWIEFEGGNPDHPVWAGCFWEEGDMPLTLEPIEPAAKWWKTEFITLKLSDLPEVGGAEILTMDPAVDIPQVLRMSSVGILLENPESSILMTAESITLTVPPAEVTLTAEVISAAIGDSTVSMTEVAIEVTSTDVNVTANVSVEGPVEVTGNVEITGAVEILGDVAITGAVEVLGDVEITGATEVLGDVSVLGAADVLGDVSVLGMLDVLGDVAVLGAVEILGDLAVPVTETICVPPLL